jgi:hypothetical protein
MHGTRTRSEVRRGDFFRFAPRERACADPQPVSSEVVQLRSKGARPEGSCTREKEEREVLPTSVELLLNTGSLQLTAAMRST